MTPEPYPVVTEQALNRPQTRLMIFTQRPLSEIPAQTPGTVLVFETDGRYEVFNERRHLTGKEPTVVDAVAVSLVDVRTRLVPVDLSIPSASPADEFQVRTTFACKVTDIPLVARNGLRDVARPLREHLKQDRRLHSLGAGCRIDDISEARELVLAQITAYCTLHPPAVPGIRTELTSVQLFTPAVLKAHAARIRDEQWRHLYERLRRTFEEEDAARLADLVRSGPESVEGLALSRGDITAGQAADRAYTVREEKERKLVEILEVLQKDGHLDRLRVDADVLIEAFTESIAPRRSHGSREVSAARRSQDRRPGLTATGDKDDLVLDEDDLDDDELDH